MKLLVSLLSLGTVLSAPHHSYNSVPLTATLTVSNPTVICSTEYYTTYDSEYTETETEVCTTEYSKECETKLRPVCRPTTRTECLSVPEQVCHTVYRPVCVQQFRTELEPYTESECTTEYEEDCEYRWEGEGNEKVWAPIPETCTSKPVETCREVSKQKERQVAHPVCTQQPEQQCEYVFKQECLQVPDQICESQSYEECHEVPHESCENVHKRIPSRVSRRASKKTCVHTDNPSYTPSDVVLPPVTDFEFPVLDSPTESVSPPRFSQQVITTGQSESVPESSDFVSSSEQSDSISTSEHPDSVTPSEQSESIPHSEQPESVPHSEQPESVPHSEQLESVPHSEEPDSVLTPELSDIFTPPEQSDSVLPTPSDTTIPPSYDPDYENNDEELPSRTLPKMSPLILTPIAAVPSGDNIASTVDLRDVNDKHEDSDHMIEQSNKGDSLFEQVSLFSSNP